MVASLGTAFTREQAKLLMQHTYQIAIIYDGDTAGSKATLRGLDILSQLGCDVRVVICPCQIPMIIYGIMDLKLGTNCPSQGLIEYKLIKTMENVNVSTIIGKTKVVEDMAADLYDKKSSS